MNERICVLRQSRFPADTHVRKHVDALLYEGFDVDVICGRQPGEAARDAYREARIFRLPVAHRRADAFRYAHEYGLFFLFALFVLTVRQCYRHYRSIEVYNLPDFLVMAAWPAKLLGARIVFVMFEVMPEQAAEQLGVAEGHPLIRLLRAIQGIAVRSADRIIVVSPYDRSLVERHRPRHAPVVVLNAPEGGVFAPREIPAREGGFLILTHGTLLARYGIETAVRAMPAILDAIPDARLRIVGDGEERPRLEALALELGVQRRVEFAGFLPYEAIPDEIARAGLCVVPAMVPWLLPNKLFEYAAMARPILCASSPSVEGVFGAAVAYHAPGDAGSFARAVIDLWSHADERACIAERAHGVYLGNEWKSMRQAYLSVHREPMRAIAAGSHETARRP